MAMLWPASRCRSSPPPLRPRTARARLGTRIRDRPGDPAGQRDHSTARWASSRLPSTFCAGHRGSGCGQQPMRPVSSASRYSSLAAERRISRRPHWIAPSLHPRDDITGSPASGESFRAGLHIGGEAMESSTSTGAHCARPPTRPPAPRDQFVVPAVDDRNRHRRGLQWRRTPHRDRRRHQEQPRAGTSARPARDPRAQLEPAHTNGPGWLHPAPGPATGRRGPARRRAR